MAGRRSALRRRGHRDRARSGDAIADAAGLGHGLDHLSREAPGHLRHRRAQYSGRSRCAWRGSGRSLSSDLERRRAPRAPIAGQRRRAERLQRSRMYEIAERVMTDRPPIDYSKIDASKIDWSTGWEEIPDDDSGTQADGKDGGTAQGAPKQSAHQHGDI